MSLGKEHGEEAYGVADAKRRAAAADVLGTPAVPVTGSKWAVDPGLVSLTQWRPDTTEVGTAVPIDAYGAVARKP